MKAYKVARTLYFIVGLLDILARIFTRMEINQYTKPLLMPLLIYYLIERTEGKVYKYHLVLGGALIFSWIGDVALMWEGELNFMGGLASFLMAHVIYIIVFKMDLLATKERLASKAPILVSFLLYGGALLYILIPSLPVTLTIAVIIYSVCILTMAATALLRNPMVLGYKEVLFGALTFVISDSVLAYSKFVSVFNGSAAIVMLTYILAQFLIVQGIARKEIT